MERTFKKLCFKFRNIINKKSYIIEIASNDGTLQEILAKKLFLTGN